MLLQSAGYPVLNKQSDGTWISELSQPSDPLEQWIVTSQECDILSRSEPYVEMMACYWSRSGNPAYTGGRIGNSYRYFWVKSHVHEGESGALIIDATRQAQVPKEALVGAEPVFVEADDPSFGRDLRRWLGGRYSRPALPQQIVDLIQRPIVDGIRDGSKRDPKIAEAIEMVRELRMFELGATSPYDIDLILLVRNDVDTEDERIATLQGWIETWIRQSSETVRTVNVMAQRTSEMFVSEYEETLKLPLDQYSAGATSPNASGPIAGIDHG